MADHSPSTSSTHINQSRDVDDLVTEYGRPVEALQASSHSRDRLENLDAIRRELEDRVGTHRTICLLL